MRVEARDIERFVGHPPPACRAVLLHGEDAGLVRERGTALTRAVAGGTDDAFRVASLDRDAHARLPEEATALSLIGGRRVVRVRDAGDALAGDLARVLDGAADALIVLEAAAALPARSKLRALCEARADAAVIPCYPAEGRALGAALDTMVTEAGARIDRDALAALTDLLGADRIAARGEIEKLALYAGEAGRIDLEAVENCVADAALLSLDDALFAATEGDVAGADRALERAIDDGAAPVSICRALLGHLARLRAARQAMEASGLRAADAASAVRPPVFFKRAPAFTRALGVWSVASLARASAETHGIELACKRTGAPDLAMVRNLVARIARGGAGRRAAS